MKPERGACCGAAPSLAGGAPDCIPGPRVEHEACFANPPTRPLTSLPQGEGNVPIESLLAHRGTMLLVDAVLAGGEESITVCHTVRPDAWYADAEGAMPAWMGIELMAQAIAAHVGLIARRQGLPAKSGVLLGSRAYRAERPAFPAGSRLLIDARLEFRDAGGLGAYDCVIRLEGEAVARATLKVYEPEDFAAFLHNSRP